MSELSEFIDSARLKGLNDVEIRQKLQAAGWQEQAINSAFSGGNDLEVPRPPLAPSNDSANRPVAMVQAASVKGFEYNLMFFSLWLTTIGFLWIINAFLFTADPTITKFPITILVVTLPVFMFFFFRLRHLEVREPEIKKDLSRKKAIQSTQTLAFVLIMLHTIYVVFQMLDTSDTLGKQIISWFGTIAVYGSIFAYYWIDTHQTDK